jgi:hypothetical protein
VLGDWQRVAKPSGATGGARGAASARMHAATEARRRLGEGAAGRGAPGRPARRRHARVWEVGHAL